MTASRELALFHEDASVAAAVGALLTGSQSVDDVATKYGVAPKIVARAIVAWGIEERVAAELPETVIDHRQRDPLAFLADRAPVTRQQRGIRDEEAKEKASDTYELEFTRALLSEAGRRARERVTELLADEFGSDITGVVVRIRAELTDREYPDHVRWIAVGYSTGDSDLPGHMQVPSPPFSFARLEEVLPKTLDVTVEVAGETLTVRNIPVVATRDYWQ